MSSGGKDSCYNLIRCVEDGHSITCLGNLYPQEGKDELDSYMYQTVGHTALASYSEAMQLPLYRRQIKGMPLALGKDYVPTVNDEVEDLYELIKDIKKKHEIEAVSVGAVFSDFQRVRVESVCERLGLEMLAYLWQLDQKELMQNMIRDGLEAIIVKVAAMGLEPHKHLGMTLSEIFPHLINLNEKYGINICGEGGEFESLVLDCSLFKKKIVVVDKEIVIHSNDAFAPVGYLRLNKVDLVPK